MGNKTNRDQARDFGATLYVIGRTAIAIVLAVAVLWALVYLIDRFDQSQFRSPATIATSSIVEKIEAPHPIPEAPHITTSHDQEETYSATHVPAAKADHTVSAATGPAEPGTTKAGTSAAGTHSAPAPHVQTPTHQTTNVPAPPVVEKTHAQPAADGMQPVVEKTPVQSAHGAQPAPVDAHAPATAHAGGSSPVGVALVNSIIEPLEYELKERFWGWRPNDLINITDNINNFQLGVLETTRRAVVQLAQQISRTGSADAFDKNLENAMSWIMTKATDYWFPSPENKYEESIEELKIYKAKLLNGNAYFYTRADNLIPLFEVFEDLLGSCDQNLVKQMEADGTKIGTTGADDYFYYAKGVAHTMTTILEGVQIDFSKTMDNRRSGELLHHAIESCRQAAELEPWIVTNADLDGILANHRANMAAPISHARYYIGQLIMTLSV